MTSKLNKWIVNKWIIALLVFPFIKPATEITGKYDIIFDILKIVSCFIIISSYIINFKKVSKIIFAISVLQFTFLLSTIINGGRVWWVAVQTISIISICALLELTMKINLKEALIGFGISTGIMATATMITMFLYRYGIYQLSNGYFHITTNYLWGFDNSSIFKFIPTMIILILSTYKADINYKRFGLVFLIYTTLAFYFVRSLTALGACIIILAIYIYLIKKKISIKILNIKNIMIIITVAIVLIFTLNRYTEILQAVFEGSNKEGSLYLRFSIWNRTINEIEKSPIIGYGFEETKVISEKLILDHPHNIFLDILYRGGILGGIVFTWMIILIIKNGNKQKNITIVDNIISAGILALMCVSQMDYYNDQYLLFLLFVLAYYSNVISNEMNGRLLSDGVKKDEK